MAVALSGGRDSVALLDLLRRLREQVDFPRFTLTAVHVHHGLQPSANAWAAFCAAECERQCIALTSIRLAVERRGGESLEENARLARYAALARLPVDAIALAHHQDDQVETLLLQLLRGAGPRGLAGMPSLTAGVPKWWRPLLDAPRAALDAYCRERSLAWVDDDSNQDTSIRRNLLRSRVIPLLAEGFPGFRPALARASGLQARAARLLRALAEIDAGGVIEQELDIEALRRLPDERAGNLLREWLARQRLRPPSQARLEQWLRQLRAGAGGTTALPHEGRVIGIHRGRVCVHSAAPPDFDLPWAGEPAVALPHGTLHFDRRLGDGIRAATLAGGCRIRPRTGGERLAIAPGRPRRLLKRILQERGLPAWERDALPLVVAGEQLVCAPGIGVAPEHRAGSGESGLVARWVPAPPAESSPPRPANDQPA